MRRQARPSDLLLAFFPAALALLVAGGAAAIAYAASGRGWLRWLAFHLALLGGVSQLVLGASQFFVSAYLATDPPRRRLVAAQLAAWNAGTGLVAAGVTTGTGGLVDAGVACVAAGLALFAAGLARMAARSLQRAPWALRWYRAAAVSLAAGAVVGAVIANGATVSPGDLVGVHLSLNLGGWLGTAIVGTLHTFFPSLTQTELRRPQLQLPTHVLWLVGVAQLATGAGLGLTAVVACGWAELALAAALLAVNLAGSLRAAPAPLTLPARLVTVAQLFLPAGLALAFAETVASGASAPFDGRARGALAALLLAGWIGNTVAGALLHLLAVLARVRSLTNQMPVPRPRIDLAITTASATAVSAVALSHAPGLGVLRDPAGAALAAIAAYLATRALALLARAIRARPIATRA